jgi:hypothetical protein
MAQFLDDRDNVGLKSLGDYLGWEIDDLGCQTKPLLHVNEVVNDIDPELDYAVDVYSKVFNCGDTAIASEEFRKEFRPPHGLAYRDDYRYHLWTLRSDADAKYPEGMVSFLRMPSSAFVGCVALLDSLRDPDMLPGLIARIEERLVRDGEHMVLGGEQMVRDGEQRVQQGKRKGRRRGVARWRWWPSDSWRMVREGERMVREGKLKLRDDEKGRNGEEGGQQGKRKGRGRGVARWRWRPSPDGWRMVRKGERMVREGERMVREGKLKLRDDQVEGRDGEGARGWYIECDHKTRDTFLGVGFWELDVEYMPPLPDRHSEPLTLHLMYKPFGRAYDKPTIKTETFLRAVGEIYQTVHAIGKPEMFAKLKESLQGTAEVPVKPKAGAS